MPLCRTSARGLSAFQLCLWSHPGRQCCPFAHGIRCWRKELAHLDVLRGPVTGTSSLLAGEDLCWHQQRDMQGACQHSKPLTATSAPSAVQTSAQEHPPRDIFQQIFREDHIHHLLQVDMPWEGNSLCKPCAYQHGLCLPSPMFIFAQANLPPTSLPRHRYRKRHPGTKRKFSFRTRKDPDRTSFLCLPSSGSTIS